MVTVYGVKVAKNGATEDGGTYMSPADAGRAILDRRGATAVYERDAIKGAVVSATTGHVGSATIGATQYFIMPIRVYGSPDSKF